MDQQLQNEMRMVGRKVGLRMGVLMSFFLALIGTVTGGHFSVPGFLISFILSVIISLVIGLVVPMGLLHAAARRRLKLETGSFPARLVETLISDIVYTPVLTLAMTAFAYGMTMKQSGGMAQIPFVPMFLKSFIICFVAGYILIFIFMPIIFKGVMKKVKSIP